MQAEARPWLPSYAFWFLWVSANTVAGAIGWAATVVMARFTLGCGLFLAGIIVGLCLGAAQYLVLMPYLKVNWRLRRDRLEWPALTFVGVNLWWMLAWLVLLVVDIRSPWAIVLGFCAGGAALGSVQWIALQHFTRSAAWWIPANVVGSGIGELVGSRAGDSVVGALFPRYYLGDGIVIGYGDLMYFFTSGVIGTLVLSVITGLVLVWLLRVRLRLRDCLKSRQIGPAERIPNVNSAMVMPDFAQPDAHPGACYTLKSQSIGLFRQSLRRAEQHR